MRSRKGQKIEAELTEAEGAAGIIATKIRGMKTITDLVGVLKDLANECNDTDSDYDVAIPICEAVTESAKSYKWGNSKMIRSCALSLILTLGCHDK